MTHVRILSAEQCQELAQRIARMATGGGTTKVTVRSAWSGNIRWGRNVVGTSGDQQATYVGISRSIRGATSGGSSNVLDDSALLRAVRSAEAILTLFPESPDQYPVPYADTPQVVHPHSNPNIWFESTYTLNADGRAAALDAIVRQGEAAGFLTAGYIEAGAQALGIRMNGRDSVARYYPYTTAQCSVTVRDTGSAGSGWAGVDFNDWTRIDTEKLARIAIEKCARSRHPVAIEPGRYTAILEPQAVCDLFAPVMDFLSRHNAENGSGPFAGRQSGFSKIGERVLDERITVGADPMDPDCGFVPFDLSSEPHVKVDWIKDGVLRALEYNRFYGVKELQKDWALPNSGAFRMSGGITSIDDMIATTERGVLVTRFDGLVVLDPKTMLCHGVTRDGLWLIERGKIAKAIKNFRITESPLFAFNNVEQLGIPQRVFRPAAPAVCPPLKVRDFSFTGLMDAV